MSKQDPQTNSGQAMLAEQTVLSTSGYISSYFKRMRSGDFGTLPIVIGLLIIALIFQSLNKNFLTPVNLVNLIIQMAGLATIAIGVVFVLLLGEIDLSIGFVSAVAGVTMTLLFLPPFNLPWFLAIPAGKDLSSLASACPLLSSPWPVCSCGMASSF